MNYVISNDYILGRDWNDVRDRIRAISNYIALNTAPDEKIEIHKIVEVFDDQEGYTRSDVCTAVLGLIEEGILRHDENDIVRSK